MTPPHRATRRGAWRWLSDAWYRLLCILLAVFLAALIVPVSLQIFSRHTALIPAYIWTEEMARLMFVWVIMIGAGLFTFGFALVFVWAGWEFTEFAIYRISELAELPLWTIHVAWPVLGVTWIIFHGEHMVRMARLAFGIDPAPPPGQVANGPGT